MEIWKYDGKEIYIRMIQLFKEIWALRYIPQDWNTSIVVPIHDKGEKIIVLTIEEYHF